jgi:uncharacterized LabA/DUF88 family protein
MSTFARVRVACFFDGKNHMKDLQRRHSGQWLDHAALAAWAVERVGGTELASAHYYTGVPGPGDELTPRRALTDLLRDVERHEGFFVHRYARHTASWPCSACGHDEVFTKEKQVDTALVADAVLMAARGAYDIAVIFSGDQDLVPAVEAVHALGLKAWVATFGLGGMSRVLGRAAWGVVDLSDHLEHFTHAQIDGAGESVGEPTVDDGEVLRELHRAEGHFCTGGGFVGAHYFLHRWRGQGLPETPIERREALERLIAAGKAQTYEVDGRSALRTLSVVSHEE